MRKRISQFAIRWVKGYESHTQFHADSEAILEYDRLCEELGPNSRQARQLKPLIEAVHARRGDYALPSPPALSDCQAGESVLTPLPPLMNGLHAPNGHARSNVPIRQSHGPLAARSRKASPQSEPNGSLVPVRHTEPQPTLTDGVVALVALTEADIPAIVAGDNDPEHAYRFGWNPGDSTEANARKFVDNSASRWQAGWRVCFGIRDQLTRSLLGGVELNMESGEGRAKISYWTFPGARRQGLATRAVKLVCQFGFDRLELSRIQIMCETDNLGSMGVARNAGFHLEGVLRDRNIRSGRRHDMLLYSLLPSDLDRKM